MSVGRILGLCVAVLAVGIYGYRAFTGAVSGLALARGHYELNSGMYTAASELLERADIGMVRLRALTMTAEARLKRWDRQAERLGSVAAERENLRVAAEKYLECLCAAPASRHATHGLGTVYDRAEWIGREARANGQLEPVNDPWARIGRPGRLSLGMLRRALERAPTWFRGHDALGITLWSYGLDELARESVRSSATVLPIYPMHSYRLLNEFPPWLFEEFTAASRDALGQTPFLPPTIHLLDLGKLQRRLGRHELAIETLRQALAARGDDLNAAEARYHLGLSLNELGRRDEGRAVLQLAASNPTFRVLAISSLAADAESHEELEAALDYLRLLRWEQPADADHCLRYARVARRLENWPAALEALRVARQLRPGEPAAWIATIEVYVDMGDTARAIETFERIREWPSLGADVQMIERWIRGRS